MDLGTQFRVAAQQVLADHDQRHVERTVEGLDMVIVTIPPVPNDGLVSELKSAGSELQVIGDCVAPRDIETAIFEGHRTAVAI